MLSRESTRDLTGFACIAGALGAVQLRIGPAQTLFGLAFVLWLWRAHAEMRWRDLPPFALPLSVYAVLTLISAAFSLSPADSFKDSRQLWLFFVVPVVLRFARGEHAGKALHFIIAVGAASALVGIVQPLFLGYNDLDHRPIGLLRHWMTYSGVLMLVTCAALSLLVFSRKLTVWPAIAVPALVVALVASQTRNAWIGTAIAMIAVLGVRQLKLALLVPMLAIVVLLVSPASVKQRAYSVIDVNQNRDRVQMLTMGVNMVKDHPIFGVGPEMVGREYGKYLQPNPVHTYNPHLHNVPMQIAAERGLPALAAWIWFVVVAARDLFRRMARGPARPFAAAGAAAVVAMLAAGMFEYNFGDSEFLILFLGLISLPYAAAAAPESPSATESRES